MDSPTQKIHPETEKLTNPQVWDQAIPGMAKFVTPIKITLKETNDFPSRRQHLTKTEARRGLQALN